MEAGSRRYNDAESVCSSPSARSPTSARPRAVVGSPDNEAQSAGVGEPMCATSDNCSAHGCAIAASSTASPPSPAALATAARTPASPASTSAGHDSAPARSSTPAASVRWTGDEPAQDAAASSEAASACPPSYAHRAHLNRTSSASNGRVGPPAARWASRAGRSCVATRPTRSVSPTASADCAKVIAALNRSSSHTAGASSSAPSPTPSPDKPRPRRSRSIASASRSAMPNAVPTDRQYDDGRLPTPATRAGPTSASASALRAASNRTRPTGPVPGSSGAALANSRVGTEATLPSVVQVDAFSSASFSSVSSFSAPSPLPRPAPPRASSCSTNRISCTASSSTSTLPPSPSDGRLVRFASSAALARAFSTPAAPVVSGSVASRNSQPRAASSSPRRTYMTASVSMAMPSDGSDASAASASSHDLRRSASSDDSPNRCDRLASDRASPGVARSCASYAALASARRPRFPAMTPRLKCRLGRDGASRAARSRYSAARARTSSASGPDRPLASETARSPHASPHVGRNSHTRSY
mmetsp:Transcript_634/g.1973  ORF Transcript_634/g.1973 Transcript_634/m.1973 type:complete len:531 (-) Transcript_634:1590-3182(-)